MGTLIRFELRKICGNRAGMVACALAALLVLALGLANLASAAVRDAATGEVVEGLAAQQVVRQAAEAHAGVLDDAHVAADAQAVDHANELAATVAGFHDLTSQQLLDTYGLEFWQQTRSIMNESHYLEVVGTLDAAQPRATSLQEGAQARIATALDDESNGYSEAEKAYWTDKAAHISWPLEYGYAGAWRNVLDYASFSVLAIVALCIALSGVFAGEYQGGTAAVALPTRRGKRALPRAKAAAAFVFATVYWWLLVLAIVVMNVAACGPDGLDLPAQAVMGFGNPYALTVGQLVVLVYALGYLVALGMAALTLALSAALRSSMPVAVIPMAYTFLGLMGLFLSWRPLAKLALLTPLSGMNYAFQRMASYAVGPLALDLPTALALLYGALVVALVPLAMRTFRRHQVA